MMIKKRYVIVALAIVSILLGSLSLSSGTIAITPPVASFTFSPSEPLVNEVVTFDASVSYDPDGSIVSYSWDFGDGTTATGMIVQHVFTNPGAYGVMLTVSDNDGLTASAIKSIIIVGVHNIAITSVTISPTEVTAGELVSITVTVVNKGHFTEAFYVSIYYDNTAIETKTVIDLAAGDSKTLMFTWNTTGVAGGIYTIKAEASVLPGETDIADNTFIGGLITVLEVPIPPVRMLSIKLSGEHDYLFMENVKIRLAVLVKDATTMEHISNADVTVEIYDPGGTLWMSDMMNERVSGTGIYEWQSEKPIRELRLKKGVYLAYVSASYQGGPTASDILQFHIDPPAEESSGFPIYYYVIAISAIIAVVGLALLKRPIYSRLRRAVQ